MKISNSTGKSKDFYNKGKEMVDRIQPLPMRKTVTEEDDDIQEYKKPWVSLTDEEIYAIDFQMGSVKGVSKILHAFAKIIETKLKEKNS